MLLSTVQNNNCGHVDHQFKNILSASSEKEEVKHFQEEEEEEEEEELTFKRSAYEKENLALSEYCDSLLNRCNISNQNILTNHTFENVCKDILEEEGSKTAKVDDHLEKVTLELEWDSNEGNNSVKMDMKNGSSCAANDISYPARFSPELKSNQFCSGQNTELEKSSSNCLDNVNSIKISSNPGLPTTSRNISRDSKMHLSADDDTNFDIFDFMKCSDDADDEVTDCAKSYCDKDDLELNEDLVDKYEKNLGLDIVKDKDICWAAGNFDSDVCPLKNYDVSNENSLLSFAREGLDGESRESFSQEWAFDESIDYVSQEQVPDPHVIVPKKTVDITKIKGWRKKQFTVDKCLANRNSILKKTNLKSDECKEASQRDMETGIMRNNIMAEDQNKDYAFVCDKLDDFLDQEAELKINYEIPHLYAEYGIKLTSEELVSRPKFKPSTVNNKLPVKILNKNVLPQKPANVPSKCSENIKTEEKQAMRASAIKKPSPKVKCAFPNKSHKNWSLWKENNLSKGKPMSLLKKELSVKRENTVDVASPCRRSDRISQAALNKPNTAGCLIVNERRSHLNDSFDIGVLGSDFKHMTRTREPIFDYGTGYSFQIRKFGMVLYPGPSAPLNPFITYHLQKIRSYRTLIDKNWANFAVSALVHKGETANRKRMVLPLSCCFKYKNEPTTNLQSEDFKVESAPLSEKGSHSKDSTSDFNVNQKLKDERGAKNMSRDNGPVFKSEISGKTQVCARKNVSVKRRESATRLSLDSALTRKINDRKFDLYEEEIKCSDDLKDEIDMVNTSSIDNGSDNMKNFSDDSIFDSDKCDIVFEKRRPKTSISRCIKENLRSSPEVIDIEDDDTEMNSTVRLSPDSSQTDFNRVIAKLLTKKLNEVKQSEYFTCSIDNLKTVKLNVLELIKLNFIKENYLSGYINLWYIKTPETGKKRVFLTFAMNPPMEGAINLKMMSRCSESDPPNIIQEIITKDKLFDPNDFAILYCDGKHWEIHGSVNFAMNRRNGERDESEKIQVFHLTKKVFPELEMLHDIKQKNDKNKVLKWWVMHMMQDYTEITVRYGDQVGRISRSIILKTWKTKVPSFIEFKGLHNVRPIGVGVNPRLWPYFVIGPYYMGDHHNLTLKLNSKIVPFEYYLPLDRVKPAFLLKRFVSSVIMHSWRNCRQVVGMWLYDRIAMKQSSFIQVRTRVKKAGSYEPNVEHDYSLCRTQDGISESNMNYNKKVPDKNNFKATREIFLVPNVPHLGYIKGELHSDQSITIEHPLKPERKRTSCRIGDWLNRIMRKRIKFVPHDFYVRWKVVKNPELVQNLEPLDRSSLGGTHILCKKGIFYLLSLTKEKIEKLGLNETVVMDAILNNPIIQEVVEVKELGKILLKKDTCDLPMADVLQMALVEIDKLEKEEISLRKSRIAVEKERASLCRQYLQALDNCEVDENSKRTIHFYVTAILEGDKNGEEKVGSTKREKENYRRLEAINKFLQNLQFVTSRKNAENYHSCMRATRETEKTLEEKISREKSSKGKNKRNLCIVEKSRADNETVRKLESKIKMLHESLSKMNGDDVSLRELLTKRLNEMSQHLEKMKRSHNSNGKLSPALEGRVDSSVPERSHYRGSSHLNEDDKNVTDTAGSDTLSIVRISSAKDSSEGACKLQTKVANSDSLEAYENNIDSMEPITENKVEAKNENDLPFVKKEGQSTEINSVNEKEEMEVNFDENMIVEIVLDEPEATIHPPKNSKCNGSENAVDSTKSSQAETCEVVETNEAEVDELPEGEKTIAEEEKTSSNTLRNLTVGGMYRNADKELRLKLVEVNSLADAKVRENSSARIEYVEILKNKKQVVIVNNKRKGEEGNELLKKLRTS